MKTEVPISNWVMGIDNRSPSTRQAEGHARDLVNLDPAPTLRARTGYESVYKGVDCRGLAAYRDYLLVVDGAALLRVYPGGSVENLAAVPPAGTPAFCIHNDEVFISCGGTLLRHDGYVTREWGVPTPSAQPPTSTPGADVLYAVTYVNEWGEEGGTANPALSGAMGTVVVPTPPPGCLSRLYVSPLNSTTLYLAAEVAVSTPIQLAVSRGDAQPLVTRGLQAPTPATALASSNGVILSAHGNVVSFTVPMSPHLMDPTAGFFQYPADVGALVVGAHGVYVSADKCYKLTGISTESPQQDTVLSAPAIPGTATTTPDGFAVWLTRYGMYRESADPREGVVRVSSPQFHLGQHESGAVGVLEHDGQSKLVATAKPVGGHGGLAASDYFEAEVVRP